MDIIQNDYLLLYIKSYTNKNKPETLDFVYTADRLAYWIPDNNKL